MSYLCHLFFIFSLIMINRMNINALVLLLIVSKYILLNFDDNVGEECEKFKSKAQPQNVA